VIIDVILPFSVIKELSQIPVVSSPNVADNVVSGVVTTCSNRVVSEVLSVDDPSDDLFCAVNEESVMCNDVNAGECEIKDKVNAEDCGGEVNEVNCGNVERVTVSDNADVDFDQTLVLDESLVATLDEFSSGELLADVFGSDDVTNLIKETSDDSMLICSAQDHKSKGEFVIDIGQLCHQDKVQDQSVSQMNFGKDSTCRNPISPEAAPCLVMNELYGTSGVQAESDCDCINGVCVCQLPESVMNTLTAMDVCCAENKQFADNEETYLNVCECDQVDERYQCVATDRRRGVSDDDDGGDDDDDDVGSHVLADVSYRRVVVSDVSRVVAEKAEIDQIVVTNVCRDSCGKLPSVVLEASEDLGEGRQVTSLLRGQR